jgi:glycogen(starch) synthase
MKKTVFIVGPVPSPIGGISTYVHSLASILASSGNDTVVLDFYPKNGKKKINGIYRHIECASFLGKIRGLLKIVWVAWATNHPIHFHFSTLNGVLIGVVLSGCRVDRCLITLHHGDNRRRYQKSSPITQQAIKYIMPKYKKVVALSEDQSMFYENLGVAPKRIDVAPVPLEIDSEQKIGTARSRSRSTSAKILTSGMLQDYYGYSDSIELCRKIQEPLNVSLSIYLYGEGDLESFKKKLMLQASGLEIEIFYEIERSKFLRELSSASLYVRPTYVDSFGMTVSEALKLGIPVVASDICQREIGTIVFRTGNMSEFKEKVCDALNSRKIQNNTSKPPDLATSVLPYNKIYT